MQYGNAGFSDDSSGNLPDSGIDPSVDKDNLFLREKENYNSSDCFCSFFYAYGVPDERSQILPGGKRISVNAPDVSGQCFDGSDGGIVALSLLGNLERETQISSFSVLLVCE